MADLKDFLSVPQQQSQPAPKRLSHPTGWEPGIDTEAGVIVHASESHNPPQDWDQILAEFKLDPRLWEVVSDRVNVRTWDAHGPDGPTRFFYWKADVRPRSQSNDRADIDVLIARIGNHRYRKPAVEATIAPVKALVVCLADWQTGPDPDGLVDLVLRLKNATVDRIRTVRPDVLYVVGMGDMIEGCGNDWYAMQTYATGAGGLNGQRDQVKLVRRLLVDLLCEWARHVPMIVVGAVPGNHGERRKDGKAFTTFEDNDDLAVFEQSSEILAANPDAYGHVRFVLPDGDMSLTLDVAGTTVGFIHGHQATKGGTTPRQKIETWWKGKMKAHHPIGDADLLVNGHYHHLCLVEDGPRTWMQCPALATSRWFTEAGGSETAMGTLTFTVTADGWDDLKVLR